MRHERPEGEVSQQPFASQIRQCVPTTRSIFMKHNVRETCPPGLDSACAIHPLAAEQLGSPSRAADKEHREDLQRKLNS